MKINARFRLETDRYNVILVETYEGKPTGGKPPAMQTRRTFHASLAQALGTVLERSAGQAEDVTGMLEALSTASAEIREALENSHAASQ